MVRPGCDLPILYPGLLGPSWMELHENVRLMHVQQQSIQGSGTFEVRRGENRLAQWLGWLARLPAAGENVPVSLTIAPQANGEEWRRSFAGQPLLSRQWARADGLLAEQVGCLELRFRLEIIAGGLHYRQNGAGLRVGPWFVPLPRWLAPRAEAWETAADGRGCVYVRVEVHLPFLGLLISYRGTMVQKGVGDRCA